MKYQEIPVAPRPKRSAHGSEKPRISVRRRASTTADLLGIRIASRKARVGVLGLGFVGLPLAVQLSRRGFEVTGFDVNEDRIAAIRDGHSYVEDITSRDLKRLISAKSLGATSTFEALREQDVIIICVQTPLRKTKEPDISTIVNAVGEISRQLRKGQLIVLESTTYPGTTEEAVLPILERSGLRLGTDFFLAFSPERVDPGNRQFGIGNTPKVVGGAEPVSTRLAATLYAQIVAKVVPVSSTRAAEVVKLLENTFRAVNIALVNEMAQICHRLGLDVWEVIEAASTKPFGFMRFLPGPGIGGHCIPKDPQLLTWKMKTLRFEPRFIQLATSINGEMPDYTVARIAQLLNARQRAINGSSILVLGAAYKPSTSDYRESPSLDVIDLLVKAGAAVRYHDPHVPSITASGQRLESVALTPKAVRSADCVAILTAHPEVDYSMVAGHAKIVFDTRNATKSLRADNVQRL